MAMFEVGEEYWLSWGTIEEQFHSPIKVVSQEGTWLQIEAEKADLDPMVNLAAPLFISARKRDRVREQEASDKFQRQHDSQRQADAERINQFRADQAKGIL